MNSYRCDLYIAMQVWYTICLKIVSHFHDRWCNFLQLRKFFSRYLTVNVNHQNYLVKSFSEM